MRKSKYNNKKTEYNGFLYASKKEAAYAQTLDMLKKAKGLDKVLSWEKQIGYAVAIADKKICIYYLDFKVLYSNRTEYVDVKGVKTAVYKLKKKMVEALFGFKIIEI